MAPKSHTEGVVYLVMFIIAMLGYKHIRGKEFPDLVVGGGDE